MTLRSNDQFNTTIYGYHDRFRGVKGTRDVLFMHEADIAADGLRQGKIVALESAAGDGVTRQREGLIVTPYSSHAGAWAPITPNATC